ncbi:choline dehydrogenase [Heterostelium album PN500]|uniref:Choline dehydrogenase n=1 Tax=Heterostelium pallidum (strain ATCC 26659 / Pp 5 / PN500) TaxID=670386 RepID=D3BJD4_HETP5|nr:choline dehydrogenase [Heterostelium album PN500]EFA78014.1 choline dehydrogenase [Heterostelium album PN500]|eukprot:XP_020430142.1 choline dehydrogenase [Heterostelium album PN500]
MKTKILIVTILIFSYCYLGRENDIFDDEYDYIVIGAGTAGSIVAGKLSDNPNNKVLLIEEDATNPNIWTTKDWYDHFLGHPDPDISRAFYTPAEPGLNYRTETLMRAVVTGGCNAHNGMVVIPGDRQLYDGIADATGESQWSWNNMASHFSELKSKFYLRHLDDNRVFLSELKQSIQSIGIPLVSDNFGGSLRGLTNIIDQSKPDPQLGQRRETTYSNYIDAVLASRSNLQVLIRNRAEKIMFCDNNNSTSSTSDRRACFIRLRDTTTNTIRTIKVGKELILSLGAYESPMLLQASGVGDPAKLSQAGITPIINSPNVGMRLLDHIYMNYAGKPLLGSIQSPPQSDWDNRNTVADGFFLFGAIDANSSTNDYTLATDIQYMWDGKIYFNCAVEMVSPQSEGEVQVKQVNGNGAAIQPLIEQNYLSARHDVDVLIAAIKECRRIQSRLVDNGILDGSKPEFSSTAGDTDQSLEQYVRNTGNGDYHPHASIRMGRADDASAPLTPRLKVRGTSNVRVIDASSFPIPIRNKINIPIAILAMQGADFITQDNN